MPRPDRTDGARVRAAAATSAPRARLTAWIPTPAIVTLIGVIVLFIALCAALILVVISLRRPRGPVLIAAAAIVVLALVTLSILPAHLPVLAAAALAILGTALAIVGGNPFTRWVLSVADGGRTTEGRAAASSSR
jgi:heme A synthase